MGKKVGAWEVLPGETCRRDQTWLENINGTFRASLAETSYELFHTAMAEISTSRSSVQRMSWLRLTSRKKAVKAHGVFYVQK